jgi:hypothetical protein
LMRWPVDCSYGTIALGTTWPQLILSSFELPNIHLWITSSWGQLSWMLIINNFRDLRFMRLIDPMLWVFPGSDVSYEKCALVISYCKEVVLPPRSGGNGAMRNLVFKDDFVGIEICKVKFTILRVDCEVLACNKY